MKRIFIILFSLILFLYCTACSSNAQTINQIAQAQLTDREKMFLSVGEKKYFVYDFNIDNTYKWIKIWVERYEEGEKVSDSIVSSMGLSINDKGLIIVTVNEDKNLNTGWTIAVKSGGSIVTSKLTEEYNAAAGSSFSTAYGPDNSKSIKISDSEIILGSILYKNTDKSTSMHSLSNEFYNDPDSNIKELKEYDLAYILKCKLYKSEQ